ncbi:MAG: 3-phosphoshikimate 1-carboxyvinyltransferase, partial [Candidatus Methanomethylophilaceae archaeon]|nr:3-phosphoshikimate 1-carboxyvinyltransferase [Candidatus Methanomethylophilaceae archaeon]
HTHRAIIMSALSGGPCKVTSPLISLDTKATMDAVRAMGADVKEYDDHLDISAEKIHAPDRTVDVCNSGTTLRLMSGISALFDSETVLTGDESIRKRPMGPLLEALEGCGASCSSDGGRAPLRIKGPVTESKLSIDGSTSSQFVSSVLMMSPLIGRPVDITLTGKTVSRPYIDITLSMMRRFGITVKENNGRFHTEPQRYRPYDYTVPADFSSAAFPLVAGGLAGKVTVTGLDMDDPQGDKRIVDILSKAGCGVTIRGDSVTCYHIGKIRALDIDMSDIPDLFPIVCVLMSTADGTSRLYGAPHLRFKESDRIALTERMLKSLGADITGTEDGCVINGVERLKSGRIDHNGDHRMMMAAAVASLISDGPVTMEDDGCWNVSFPGFPDMMRKLGVE